MPGGDLRRRRSTSSAEIRSRIVELRNQDWTFREIADHPDVNLDVANVWRHYQAAMRLIPAAAVEEHQAKVATRLDEQLRRIDMAREIAMDILAKRHVHISNGHVVSEITGQDEETGRPIYGDPYEDDAPTMAAIDRLQKLDDQEAKLLGMYPKQQVAITRETSEVDAAVIGMINRARERAEAQAAEIRTPEPDPQ